MYTQRHTNTAVQAGISMNRSDFQKLAELRIKEAQILLENNCFEGAYYLAGYAVECALKACIARKTQQFDFPPKRAVVDDMYKHDLLKLINVSGLKSDFEKHEKESNEFAANWGTIKDWSEEIRYNTTVEQKRAIDVLAAITDKDYGILEWLKKSW